MDTFLRKPLRIEVNIDVGNLLHETNNLAQRGILKF